MQDGATRIVELAVECPKCRQENMVRVATGSDIDSLRSHCVHALPEPLDRISSGSNYCGAIHASQAEGVGNRVDRRGLALISSRGGVKKESGFDFAYMKQVGFRVDRSGNEHGLTRKISSFLLIIE